ncbi:hypothetical protein [Kordia sp.]|uniref:hypothetical protein n=1 Tax=Kordia sp. TaxID=1965332 RepID=UPI003D6B47FE
MKTILFSLSFIVCVSCAVSQEKKSLLKEEVLLKESTEYVKKIDSLISLSNDMEYSTKYVTQRISEGTITLSDSLKTALGSGSFNEDTYTNQETDEIVKIRYSTNLNYNKYSISKDGLAYEREEITIYYKKEKAYVIFYSNRKRDEKDATSNIKHRFQVTKEGNIKDYSPDEDKNKTAKFVLRFSKRLIEDK